MINWLESLNICDRASTCSVRLDDLKFSLHFPIIINGSLSEGLAEKEELSSIVTINRFFTVALVGLLGRFNFQ